MTTINELKKQLIQATVICEMEGLFEAFGHITVRIPGTDHILMTPQGPPGGAKLRDVVELNLKGEKISGGGRPNTELPIHTCIYRARNDVQSVVHVHPPKVIAFSIAGKEIFPMLSSDRKLSPSVKIFGEPGGDTYIASDELGDKMVQTLGDKFAVILRGHGAVTVGDSIEGACLTAIALERAAGLQFMASMLLLSQATGKDFQTIALSVRDETNRIRIQKRTWDFYLQKLEKYLKKGT
jgi:ribulose-5-phosphate 4-epimerase/fuculose-1-phosphate aldolase